MRFGYEGEDGKRRETLVELKPAAARIETDGHRAASDGDLELAPGEAASLLVTIDPGYEDPSRETADMEQAAVQLERAHQESVAACARITTDNEQFDRCIDASVRDLHALMMPAAGGALPAAGIPWYVAPFGRDSLLASPSR